MPFGMGAGVNMLNGVGAAMYQPQIAATPAAQSRLSELMGRSQGTSEAQARLSELAGKDDAMTFGEGLSMAGGILGIGAGVTAIAGAIGQASNIKASAALNQALAEEQASYIARRGRMERAAIRKGRAAERGKIRAAAAGAGIEESGSVLRALEINAEERAQDEFVSEMNELMQTNAALSGARMQSAMAGPAGTAAIVGGVTSGFAAGAKGGARVYGAWKAYEKRTAN